MNELVEAALFTDDIETAKAFYRQLLGAPPDSDWPGGAVFSAGAAKLLVHERGAGMDDGPPNEDHLALGVADLDAVYQELVGRGVAFVAAPRDYPWGRSAYLRDPDGRLVELTQS